MSDAERGLRSIRRAQDEVPQVVQCPKDHSTGRLDQADRGVTPGFVVSAIVHISLIAVLGMYGIAPEVVQPRPLLNSRWSPVSPAPVNEPQFTHVPVTLQDSADAGGTTAVGPLLNNAVSNAIIELPQTSRAPDRLLLTVGEMGQPLAGGPLGSSAAGTGTGSSQGTGSGAGFFGSESSIESVVFVVDCSGSMNRPHASEAKTRFRRLKFELVKSIGNMTPAKRFFILFFNDRAHPMPAAGLQWATPDAQQHYLTWMAKVPAVGDTDPRSALHHALRLGPEAIYFLTDGSFAYKIDQDLLKLRQRRVAIHTFAFGDRGAEAVMKSLANNNGGQYHFVP